MTRRFLVGRAPRRRVSWLMATQMSSIELLKRPVIDLPDDLRALVEEAERADRAVGAAEAHLVHCLAELSRAAQGRHVTGGSAIEACAAALGISRQTLQPLALIASRWGAAELREMFQRRGTRGRSMTASHMVLLARLPREQRAFWTERSLDGEVDVRELRRALGRKGRRSEPQAEVGADASALAPDGASPLVATEGAAEP